ncbi:MAG TPA: threonine/serine dehydratase [Stellaceae bacterium]|nr:threonine/serine dehydratase [Stellaceae bacterium]
MTEAGPPEVADVHEAASRLKGQAVLTPLLESAVVNARLGGRLLIKAETLQRTGSFKFRGAFNALAQVPKAQRRAGVVAYSSGNHAQGVAAAARLLGMPALIVMPADAPAIKIANTRELGAEIVFYDRNREERETIAAGIADERGALLLPPFDDARVIAGQGTVGLELAAQAAAVGARLDAVVIACSGGGLVSGCALALAEASPGTRIYAAEPAGFDDMRRSLAAGERLRNEPGRQSICDALLAPMPGVLPFAIARRLLAGSLTVTDDEVGRAMALAFADYKLVVEPGGAAALAAVLAGKIALRGRTIAVVASGGNVDREVFCRALAGAAEGSSRP